MRKPLGYMNMDHIHCLNSFLEMKSNTVNKGMVER